jgi:hypothetical protein
MIRDLPLLQQQPEGPRNTFENALRRRDFGESLRAAV